jgi:hypothetical protein
MRMNRMRGLAVAGLALVVFSVAALPASADPTKAKNSATFPASCSNGTTVEHLVAVVNNANGQGSGTQNNPKGQANFAPAHVVGSNAVFHPTKFDLTFMFTPVGGPPQSFLDTATRPNGPAPVSCSVNFSTTDPHGNTFSFSGTVGGYFT